MAESPREVAASLELWVRESLPKAMAFARSLMADSHTCEDIVHDAFCRLIAKRETYDLVHDGWKLLVRSIANAAIDYRRRIHPELLDPIQHEASLSVAQSNQANTFDPSQIAIGHELEIQIRMLLDELPWLQKTILEMKSLGLRTQEIADSVSLTENHVGVLLHRARATMASKLKTWLTNPD